MLLISDREVTATKARQLGRTGVIVGDRVRVVGDTSGEEGTLARIVQVEERETVLRRTADDDDPYERPIVANADQLVIVTALADPPPRTGMIDRILVAGYAAGIQPLLCLTKADLASPDVLIAEYEPLGVPVEVIFPGADLDPLRAQAARAPQRLRRSLRSREVHAGQCLDPWRRSGDRCGERGDRTGSAHLLISDRAPTAGLGQLLGDRHARRTLLRPQPCQP